MSIYKKYINIQGGSVPYISGSKGGCFPAGSFVSTPKGNLLIENLKINDIVYCYDAHDNIQQSYVEKCWKHIPEETDGYMLTITHEKGQFRVTDNHYLYWDTDDYKEAKDFKINEYLTLQNNYKSKILDIKQESYNLQENVYNLTINTHHNYICEGVRLSNKGGGGKGGGGAAPAAVEDPNTLFSTDILFLTVSIGEGPVYRINPNGPQDIEINEGAVDDLINLDGDGLENNEVFKTLTTTGTLSQGPLDVFGAETITPQSLQNGVTLKNGNVSGVPKAQVLLQNTSAKDWDKLRFNFVIQGLQKSDASGNVSGTSLTVKITVFDRVGTTVIVSDEHTVSGKTNTRFKFQRDLLIPEASRSLNGYKFTVEKTSGDSDSNRIADNVQFTGWDEIEFDDMAYPRSAIIGYAIKSFNEHEGRVPTFTSLIKGLLVKVPSNYNQPVLTTGEIDWREVELPETGSTIINGTSTNIGYTQNGYHLQTTGTGTNYANTVAISARGSLYSVGETVTITAGIDTNPTINVTANYASAASTIITGKGTGHEVDDVLTVVGGTSSETTQFTVDVIRDWVSGASIIDGTGSGYAVSDNLAVAGGTADTAAYIGVNTVKNNVSAIAVSAGGSGYAVSDVLTVAGGTSTTTATGTVGTIKNIINAAPITVAGTGYAVSDVLTLVGGTSSTAATVTVSTIKNIIASATISAAGSGYSVNDVLTISGGTSTTAGTVTVSSISTINSQNQTNFSGRFTAGSGYAVSDTITLSDGSIITVAAQSGGAITQFSITGVSTSGQAENPVLTQSSTSGGGSSFNLTLVDANQQIFAVSLTEEGVYTVNPSSPASVTGGTGSNAAIALTFTNGIITAVSISQAGVYTGANPGNPLSTTGGSGSSATFSPTWTNSIVTGISITESGVYTGANPSNPVTTTGGSGSGCTLTLTWTNGIITASTLNDTGYYSVQPSNPVSTTGGTGTGATFTLTFTTDGVQSVTISRAGEYTVKPSVPSTTTSDAAGTGATFTTTYTDGIIDTIEILAAGLGMKTIEPANPIATTSDAAGTGATITVDWDGPWISEVNPLIYKGIWDGTFVYSWTQNPIWIIYDILTNGTYGLNIDEDNIDKFMFYKVAQYCDACDFTTGRFKGVDGFSDGTFRNKPRDLFTSVREALIGIPRALQVKERRFISDISIQEDVQVIDTINKITSTFRGLLYYSGGKITLNIDIPDDTPIALFNDANIRKDSLKFKGTKESDILTGVDVSYIDPANHFKREVIRIDDQTALRDKNQIENTKQIDLAGVTRRSQATRYGQYLIASSKFLRRQVEFQTGSDALNLSVGDIITVATKSHGLAYGFGGKIASNSTVGGANILLEHFTSPAITQSTITGNTNPLAIRIIKLDSDRVDFYLASNSSYTAASTGNAESGIDLVELVLTDRFNYNTKTFSNASSPGDGGFLANNIPLKGDLWTFGETNPNNFYANENDRLFKITSLKRSEEEQITVEGVEYISNVYVDSDSLIAHTPVRYDDTVSSLTPPPVPELTLSSRPRRLSDGSVVHDLLVDTFTDTTGYPLYMSTELQIARPDSNFIPYLSSNANSNPLYLTASNTQPLANGELSILSGKSGFKTRTGEIKLLCDSVVNINTTDTSNGNVVFSCASLPQVHDVNFDTHVLSVNDGTFDAGLKGFDRLSFEINQKTSTGTGLLGFVDNSPRLVEFSANIVSFDLSAKTMTIENEHAQTATLFSILQTPPFYVKIQQLIDTRYFDERSMYISGSEFTEIHSNVLTGNINVSTGTFTQPLTRSAPFKEAVRLFIDGIEKTISDFNFSDSDNNSIVVSGLSNEALIRVETEHYTVPVIEPGDNLQFHSGNVYSVVNASYSTDSAAYNATLTTNSFYRITLGSDLRSNTRGTTAINISSNPVGTTNNVIGNAFTFDYDSNKYPGRFSLANNAIYDIVTPTTFDSLNLPADKLLKSVEPGLFVVRSRNVNSAGRKSAYVTDTLLINQIPIQKVTGLSITESLYLDTTVGAAVRVTIEFDHIISQEVTDYEVSYKLGGTATDLTTFNTVKVSATGVNDDGKIRFTINNVDRGATTGINNITIRVTALNKQIKGVTIEKTETIVGKTAAPQNITGFSIGQLGENLHLFWQYVTTASGEMIDIDLRDVIIKRAEGAVDEDDFASAFVTAPEYVIVSAGSTRKVSSIDTYGTFTYLVKARDTSGNLSTDVVGLTFTSIKLSGLFLINAYSEDAPTGNVFAGIPNANRTEVNYESFANSNTGGVSSHFDAGVSGSFNSHIVDNANGTAVGYSAVGGAPTDLLAGENAVYQTQIRDIGDLSIVSLTANIQGTATTATSWNSLHQDFASGVTEENADTNTVLIDTGLGGSEGIGTVLGFSNTFGVDGSTDAFAAPVIYAPLNETLISGGSSGNVWAIWNDGQFTDDTSNANSYALIASVINADAVLLGESFFANGVSTGGNTFSNLTTLTGSYKLVDLNQFADSSSAATTYLGDSSALSYTTELRTSKTDPFFANSNVDITTLDGSIGDRFTGFSTGDRNIRYFQIKHSVTNTKPNEVNFVLDKFEYTVDAASKEFTKSVTFDGGHTPSSDTGGNTFVDYSSTGFLNTPTIAMTIVSTSNVLGIPVGLVIGATNTGANINVLFTSNSEPAMPSEGVSTIVGFTALGT